MSDITWFFLTFYIVSLVTIICAYVLPFVGIILLIRDFKKKQLSKSTAIVLGLVIVVGIPYYL